MEFDIIKNSMTGHTVICWQLGNIDFDLVCADNGQYGLHVDGEPLYIRPDADDPIWYHLNDDGSISDRRVADSIPWLPQMLDSIIASVEDGDVRVSIRD